ncbi:MAG TPA: fumarylacetoacetate hydrolase family protein [Alphaproteobacteria bacterium]|nr:fumarylacetoacetate hydrolase family protein [Alphaproteobacteria bacterium]
MRLALDPRTALPSDAAAATLAGRAWIPGVPGGPSPVLVEAEKVVDLGGRFATLAELMAAPDPVGTLRAAAAGAPMLGATRDILRNSAADARDPQLPFFLAPCDLQPVKACGVTFAASLLERVIEEHARGNPAAAEEVRQKITAEIGGDLARVKPGSPAASRLKALLLERGLWSQYLEVGIGSDAEVFSKAPPMASVGTGAEIGIHPRSVWNNPEPEVVLVVNPRGEIVGATLGNDVNLRDFEGRSALLLGRSKENNASSAIGPFVRLFDAGFTLDDVRRIEVALKVEGDDGFVLEGASSMAEISRDPADLVAQTMGAHHQYPDGVLLFLGTMFAPVKDREAPGRGFTHKLGDLVTISTPRLGALVNRVNRTDAVPPWDFGLAALMANLKARGRL